MPEPRDLIHISGEDIIVGPKASRQKRNVRGRRGKFVRYTYMLVEVDGETFSITPEKRW